MGTRQSSSPALRGSMWMLGAVFSLSAIAVGVRELAPHMTPFEMVFFRAVFSMLILVPFVVRVHRGLPKTEQLAGHFMRNVAHYCGQVSWYFGLTTLPLAKVFAIEFSTPIWVLPLAAILLAERITRLRMLAVALGIIGVLIILRPGIIPLEFAAFVVLGGALFFAISHVLTGKLARHDSPLHIVFYMSLFQVPVSLVPALQGWVSPSGWSWAWLLFIAVMSITAHYSLSRALTIADASVVIPMDYLRLPLIVLVGYLIYQEGVDWFVLLGATVIFAGNILNLRHEHRSHHMNKEASD